MRIKSMFMAGLLILALSSCHEQKPISDNKAETNWNAEVVYHVLQRSFYDSDGDGHGDLKGFTEKLDYLQDLGVTAILFTPLYESEFYHNYFPIDYEKIDPEYGSMQDYFDFVDAVHDRGMKFIMDMETQYVQSGNIWFEDSYRNPESPYSDFIFYHDEENKHPQQFLRKPESDIYRYRAWPDQEISIFHIDMNNPEVKEWMKDYYAFWVDPHGDGSLRNGVDGFRIDHIMDDLDYLGIFTNLYEDFWNPVLTNAKSINPDLFIVGEQSNWAEYGEEMIEASGADASFGFMIRFAITDVMAENPPAHAVNHTAANIGKHVAETTSRLGKDMYYVHFLENHDINRWASIVGGHQGKIRAGAVLNFVLPGVPAIYYGQELGVTGLVRDWNYDVDHIPVREAFPWTTDVTDKGIAAFYKDTGPWWDISYFNTGKVREFALSVQQDNPSSLWHLYRDLIKFRKESDALINGDFKMILPGDDNLLAFSRESEEQKITVYINLSEEIHLIDNPANKTIHFEENISSDEDKLEIAPYGFIIFSE